VLRRHGVCDDTGGFGAQQLPSRSPTEPGKCIVYRYIPTYTCMNIHIYTYVYICMYVYMYTYVCICIYTCICRHICVYYEYIVCILHIYIHINEYIVCTRESASERDRLRHNTYLHTSVDRGRQRERQKERECSRQHC